MGKGRGRDKKGKSQTVCSAKAAIRWGLWGRSLVSPGEEELGKEGKLVLMGNWLPVILARSTIWRGVGY